LAKVNRDRIIEDLKEEFGDFGSGYMSDPKTQKFLKDCYQEKQSFPPIVRHKWSSVQKFLVQQQRFINI
jgi:ribonuclease HII